MYWAEFLQLESAKPLAYYDHPFFGRWPAITRNTFGAGSLTYEGTFVSEAVQRAIVLDVLKDAEVSQTSQDLPVHVREKSGVNGSGKKLHYFLNYSGTAQEFTYNQGTGTELLSGKTMAAGSVTQLAPWDLVIVEEK